VSRRVTPHEPHAATGTPEARAATPVVVKLGGRALDGADAVDAFARELAACGAPVVLVHGGGAEVSAWLERAGLAPQFLDGLRVTDGPTLEVAAAVLAGLANKRLVAALRAAGLDAVGLAALDGGLVACVPHRDADTLGHVGEVAGVDPALLATLLGAGRVPVVASIGDHAGALLNLNADDVASALAGALGARLLLLLSDTPGLVLDGAVVGRVSLARATELLGHPEVQGGMRPKLAAAAAAVAGGAARARIARRGGPGSLAGEHHGGADGTEIGPDPGTKPGAGEIARTDPAPSASRPGPRNEGDAS